MLTLANVGDSRAVLDTGAEVIELSCDHRIGNSPAELARLEAAGGRLARLNEWGSGPSASHHEGLGPVRLWPGGVMVGRAVGDRDVGDILLAAPALRQVRRHGCCCCRRCHAWCCRRGRCPVQLGGLPRRSCPAAALAG